MELLNKIIAALPELILVLTSIVGSASLLFAFIQKVFNLTPDDKWNTRLNAIQTGLAWVLSFLDRIAVNPDEKGARKCNDDEPCEDDHDHDEITGAGA